MPECYHCSINVVNFILMELDSGLFNTTTMSQLFICICVFFMTDTQCSGVDNVQIANCMAQFFVSKKNLHFFRDGTPTTFGLLWPLILNSIHFLQPLVCFSISDSVFNILNKLLNKNKKILKMRSTFGLCECEINKYVFRID